MTKSAIDIRGELIKLAVFATVALMVLAIVGLEFSQTRTGDKATYSAVFSDVTLLEEGDPVQVFGVEVGKVTDASLYDNDKVKVEFEIQARHRLSPGSGAMVRYENLMGDRFLELTDVAHSGPSLEPGSTIPLARTSPALELDALLGGFRPLFEGLNPRQINQLSTALIAVLQGEAGTLETLLARLGSVTGTLADRDHVIGRVVRNLNVVLGTLDERDAELTSTVVGLQRLMTGLKQDRHPLLTGLERINTLSTNLAGLLEQVRPPLKATVRQVDRVGGVLVAEQRTLQFALRQLPVAYLELSRLGAYGSFFNFYMCSVRVMVTGPRGEPVTSPEFASNENVKRCQPQR